MRKATSLLAGAAMGAALIPLLLAPAQFARVTSPDGRFYAIAAFPAWKSCIPVGPGQAGDKSGHVMIYTVDGQSCGRAPVERVSFIRDLEWTGDRAEIRVVAEWDLKHRRVHRVQ